jgi:hypothetical protein
MEHSRKVEMDIHIHMHYNGNGNDIRVHVRTIIIYKVPKETVRWGIIIVQSEASILHYAKPVLCAAEHIHRL